VASLVVSLLRPVVHQPIIRLLWVERDGRLWIVGGRPTVCVLGRVRRPELGVLGRVRRPELDNKILDIGPGAIDPTGELIDDTVVRRSIYIVSSAYVGVLSKKRY
jgi:hypothetical protein